MPWNGSGTYVLPSNSLSPTATSGTVIVSTDFNELTNDLQTALTNCLTGDGTNHVVTVDLPMGGNKHTGVDDGAALTDYASVNQVVDNTLTYGTSATLDDDYLVTLAINPVAYAEGNRFQFTPDTANTGACTVNFDSIGVKNIKMADASDPYDGAIQADVPCDVMYDGTSMILMNPYFSGATTTASAAELNFNDGAIAGTVVASKTVVVDASKDISTFGEVTAATFTGTNVDGILGANTPAAITGTVITASTTLGLAAGTTVNDIDITMAGSPTDNQLLTAQGISEFVATQLTGAEEVTSTTAPESVINASITFAGGLIIKFGVVNVNATSEAVTFATAFPSNCWWGGGTGYNLNQTGGGARAAQLRSVPTTAGLSFSTDTLSQDTVYWIAIGN